MSNDDFTLSAPLDMTGLPAANSEPAPKNNSDAAGVAAQSGCSAACPLSQIPAKVWKDLLRPPFRKRHPIIFWLGALLVAAILIGLPLMIAGGQGLMGGPRIALVSVNGAIMDADPILEWIRKVERNPAVAGVLLRVDSPGGGAAASQEIYQAMHDLAQKKPVVVSMGSMAASGGLMVSMAGKRVFANASTVTGSIGVRMDIPQLQGLMGKIGVGQETLTTAPYKDAGSYMRPLTPDQREYFKGVLDDMHQQFVEIVATGRHMDHARAAALANGKIYTGREALNLGLVDELGGQDAALAWLAGQCGVPTDRKLLTRPKEEGWLPRGLKTMLGLNLDALGIFSGNSGDWRTPVFLYQF